MKNRNKRLARGYFNTRSNVFRLSQILLDSQFIERYQYWCLAAITLLGFVLRFYKLGEWSFGGDEIITIEAASDTFGRSLLPSDIPGRGLSLALIDCTLSLLGTNEWTARLVPALVGIASIPIFYLIARKMFSPAVGLSTALLLAVSPWHIEWSQNARYLTSLVLFFSRSFSFQLLLDTSSS
jgi:mannosyltransferase